MLTWYDVDPQAALDAEGDPGRQNQALDAVWVPPRIQAEGEVTAQRCQGNDGLLQRKLVADALTWPDACCQHEWRLSTCRADHIVESMPAKLTAKRLYFVQATHLSSNILPWTAWDMLL